MDGVEEAYATYQAAERAYYAEVLFPVLGSDLTLSPEGKAEADALCAALEQARSAYFEALTAPRRRPSTVAEGRRALPSDR